MRKIFLDLGANNGCSVKLFTEIFKDYNDYEIHSFECSDTYYDEMLLNVTKLNLNNFTPHKKAVWINNGKKQFTGWEISNTKIDNDNYGVDCIDISSFILENFSKEDYIILKMDIEGAEYKVIEKMEKDSSLGYITEFYGELHGPKKGYSVQDNKDLLNRLNNVGLKLYNWDAQVNIKYEKIEIVPFDTEGSYLTPSSPRVGHAYKKYI